MHPPRRRALLALAIALSVTLFASRRAAAAQPSPRLSFPVERRVLPSGLSVILAPDPQLAGVSVVVRYDVGSRDEPQGLNGVAHLVEHLMFDGSKHVPSHQFARILEGAGATAINGHTTEDTTTFEETVPREALELALWLESDRMGFLLDTLSDRVIDGERDVVMNERRQRVLDVPLGAMPILVSATLFPGWHPYSRTPSGTLNELSTLRTADVRAFVGTWYTPSNATLVLVGDFEAAKAMALVERYFAALPARAAPKRPVIPPLALEGNIRIKVAAGVTRRALSIAWPTPRFGAPGDAELDVAATILASAEGGWLRQVLVDERRVATALHVRQRSMDLLSVFEIDVVLADSGSPEDALDTIDDAIDHFATRIRMDDIERAKRRWLSAKVFALESGMARAYRLSAESRMGVLGASFDGGIARHEAVDAAGIIDAVNRYLKPRRRVVATVFRSGSAPPRGIIVGKEID